MTKLPVMTELGRGMGWHAGTVLAMLWMYLDESGEHARDGSLVSLVLGGGIASFPSWEALSSEWASILESFEIPMFHMADFEARQKPFDGWGEDRRRSLLSRLLDIAVEYVPLFFGTIDKSNKPGVRARYRANLAKTIKEMWIGAHNSGEAITVVFSAHRDMPAEFMGRAFDFWNKEGDLTFGGFADPIRACPLQVADIVAYEFCRAARSVRPAKTRYPLERLKARHCFLLDAETLGVREL
jgi:hypothetical protein